ncbi:MAG: amino acid ABC transporter permease [Anaerofustis stercorihominis]|nr:amino acid ABC transporter permease [Anaerofustis stercorihominis]
MNYGLLLQQMLSATFVSLELFFFTTIAAIPLGLLVTVMRMSRVKIINIPTRIYILLMRGTPLMLQLMFMYYALKPLFGIQLPRMTAAVVAYILNYAAYFCEIFRGGIEAIDNGQYEAAKVLGYTQVDTFFKIILPQVVKIILPSMSNEFITLVKDTALAQIIAVNELMKITEYWVTGSVNMTPFVIAGVFYLTMNAVVTRVFDFMEKKLSYYR